MITMDTILRVRAGSHAYGLNTETSDEDFIEVFIEPMVRTLGPSDAPPKAQHSGPNPAAASHSAQDTTRYPLRKFLHLALQGNPTVLESLHSPLLYATAAGYELKVMGREGVFISKEMVPRYRGYMRAQTLRLLGLKGGHSAGKEMRRTEASERAGYDTKYAMHIMRLGFFCLELMTSGGLELPMPRGGLRRERLMAIRRGEIPFDDFFDQVLAIDAKLERYAVESDIPETPDRMAVTSFSVRAHMDHYRRELES